VGTRAMTGTLFVMPKKDDPYAPVPVRRPKPKPRPKPVPAVAVPIPLNDEAHAAFTALLDAPPQPNERLRKSLETPAPWEK
jgi:hypothetical protein